MSDENPSQAARGPGDDPSQPDGVPLLAEVPAPPGSDTAALLDDREADTVAGSDPAVKAADERSTAISDDESPQT